jgi:glycosyltransferase involved in cell wall biosynthesis
VNRSVSVVIPTHSAQRWESLARTIGSVERQELRPAEIIVVVDHNPRSKRGCGPLSPA